MFENKSTKKRSVDLTLGRFHQVHLSGQGIPFFFDQDYGANFGLPIMAPMRLVKAKFMVQNQGVITTETITIQVAVYNSANVKISYENLTFGGTSSTVTSSLVCPDDCYLGFFQTGAIGEYHHSAKFYFQFLFKYTEID